MKYKLYAKAALLGTIVLMAANPAEISARSFENGLPQIAMARPYEKVVNKRLFTEAGQLEKSLRMIDVTARSESFPAKRIYDVSEREFWILSRIVEAEATDKDMKSKILVANVVINRWKSSQFPDDIAGVVFQRENGAVQFSPTADGRYESVDITQSSVESVDRALKGEDYSMGALYFVERSFADPDNVSWFDRALTRLFEYQGHAFYK
jgi:N-acetylmuramoyl-L-alanine amidase